MTNNGSMHGFNVFLSHLNVVVVLSSCNNQVGLNIQRQSGT